MHPLRKRSRCFTRRTESRAGDGIGNSRGRSNLERLRRTAQWSLRTGKLPRTADTGDHSLSRGFLFHEARVRLRRSKDFLVLFVTDLGLEVFTVLGVLRIALRHRQEEVGFLLVTREATGKHTAATAQRATHESTSGKSVDDTIGCFGRAEVEDRVGGNLEDFLKAFRTTFDSSACACVLDDTARAPAGCTLEDVHRGLLLLGCANDIATQFTEQTARKDELRDRIGQTAKDTNTKSDSAITFAAIRHGFAVGCASLLEDVRCSRETSGTAYLRGTASNLTTDCLGTSKGSLVNELSNRSGRHKAGLCGARRIGHGTGRQEELLLSSVECLTL